MKEIHADLWQFHAIGEPIVITTNGTITRTGRAVMGRGVVKQAAIHYPTLPYRLAKRLKLDGTQHVFLFPIYSGTKTKSIITFPVKHHWQHLADFDLIRQSVDELAALTDYMSWSSVYLPRPGCGNGGLLWDDVKPILAGKLDDRFTVCWL